MINNSKNYLIILTLIILGSLIIINSMIFYLISPDSALIAMSFTSCIIAIVLSVVIALHYRELSKINSGGIKFVYYFKRIWSLIIYMVVLSIGIAIAGGFMTYATATIIRMVQVWGGSYDIMEFNSVIFTLPIFIVYMTFIYRTYVKLGFLDCSKQVFNFNLKIMILIVVLILVLPSAIMGTAYSIYTQDGILVLY